MSNLRVSVLGYGAIGSAVAGALGFGMVPGAELSGVVVRRPGTAANDGYAELGLEDALEKSDVVVECAGIDAVREMGPAVIASGTNLLVSSVGALLDEDLRSRLLRRGPGRTFVTSGAIGGLDVLAAAARDGGLDALELTSTKSPAAVIQPWMDEPMQRELREASGPRVVFSGSAAEAIDRFPRSLNVGIALALATNLWEKLVVTMVSDTSAALTTHRITASGTAGDYEFTIRNKPHPDNPATSGVLPAAILNGLTRLASPSGTFV